MSALRERADFCPKDVSVSCLAIRSMGFPESLKDTLQHSSLIVPDELMERWPAPFTAILKAPDGSTHAVRVPSDPFIQDVIAISGPIFSTSVNFSGEPSLLSFDDILPVFSDSVDFIVRDTDVRGGLPSTLIDATEYPFRVLRQGGYRF